MSVTPTNVAATTGPAATIPGATRRVELMITNSSTGTLNVAVGFTATSTAFTVQLAPNGYFEVPDGAVKESISLIWPAAATGNAEVTEVF